MQGRGKLQQEFHEILGSSYYWEQIVEIENLLVKSRSPQVFRNPSELYQLQGEIISCLSQLEQIIRDGKNFVQEAIQEGDADKERSYRLKQMQNKALVYVIQSIADGLAWRVLDFDRAFIRVMSEPKRARGSVDFAVVVPGMEDVAIRLMYENGSRILFNDISHYLRLGDLIEIKPSGELIIHELKRDGKTVKNAYTITNQSPKAGISKQMQNIVQAQTAFNERKMFFDNEEVPFGDFCQPFQNNLLEVGNLISEARRSHFARTKFGNYLEILCWDIKSTITHSLHQEHQFWKKFDLKSSFDSSDIAVDLESWDSWYEELGDFTRNKTPYSIYPFSVSDCMGLISGELRLIARLNLSELHRMYSVNGWQVSDFGLGQLKNEHSQSVQNRNLSGMYNIKSSMKAFTISRNGFNLDLPLTLLLQVATDFMKPELLLSLAEYDYNTSVRGVDRTIIQSIRSEKDVWI